MCFLFSPLFTVSEGVFFCAFCSFSPLFIVAEGDFFCIFFCAKMRRLERRPCNCRRHTYTRDTAWSVPGFVYTQPPFFSNIFATLSSLHGRLFSCLSIFVFCFPLFLLRWKACYFVLFYKYVIFCLLRKACVRHACIYFFFFL